MGLLSGRGLHVGFFVSVGMDALPLWQLGVRSRFWLGVATGVLEYLVCGPASCESAATGFGSGSSGTRRRDGYGRARVERESTERIADSRDTCSGFGWFGRSARDSARPRPHFARCEQEQSSGGGCSGTTRPDRSSQQVHGWKRKFGQFWIAPAFVDESAIARFYTAYGACTIGSTDAISASHAEQQAALSIKFLLDEGDRSGAPSFYFGELLLRNSDLRNNDSGVAHDFFVIAGDFA